MMRGWLAADIGGTKLAVAAYDGEKLFARTGRPTAGHRGAEAVLDDLTDMLRCCAEEAGMTEILGVGVACPGPPVRPGGGGRDNQGAHAGLGEHAYRQAP